MGNIKVVHRFLALVCAALTETVKFIVTTPEHIAVGEGISTRMLDRYKLWRSEGVLADKLLAFVAPERDNRERLAENLLVLPFGRCDVTSLRAIIAPFVVADAAKLVILG